MSVVMAARNEEPRIGAQLAALADQQVDGGWELVLVDDASTDGTRQVIERHEPQLPDVTVLSNEHPQGLVASVVRGVEAARGSRIVFLDADDVVAAGYLRAMDRALDAKPLVCARLELQRLNTGWVGRQRAIAQVEGVMPWPGWLPWGHGCSLAVDASQVDVAHHMGTQLRAGDRLGWDVAFCWSVQLAGHALGYVPDAVLHYRFRDTLREVYRQAVGYGRSQVPRYRHFRDHGLPRRGRVRAVLGALATILQGVTVRDRGSAARWLFDVGLYVGRLRGSVEFRTWYL